MKNKYKALTNGDFYAIFSNESNKPQNAILGYNYDDETWRLKYTDSRVKDLTNEEAIQLCKDVIENIAKQKALASFSIKCRG